MSDRTYWVWVDEWWPFFEVTPNKDEAFGEHVEVPAELAERHFAAMRALGPVQEELRELMRGVVDL